MKFHAKAIICAPVSVHKRVNVHRSVEMCVRELAYATEQPSLVRQNARGFTYWSEYKLSLSMEVHGCV
jgi:hypothetical protein